MSNMLKLLIVLFLFAGVPASPASDLRMLSGKKFPNSSDEGTAPVEVSVLAPRAGAPLRGFTELLPYALRSPDQDEAGSCLYMSLTGIAEWWLARLDPAASRAQEGPLDLSERYLMNIAGYNEAGNGVRNWKTDTIFLFNNTGGALRNSDYRFTKGWYRKDANGNAVPATQHDRGAAYGTSYNWVDELAGVKAPLVPLPRFARNVLFADPASNQWNTGVAPADIAERIKTALRVNKAPVHVIYNHMGYWHATVILGYDDEGDNQNCHFVNRFLDTMTKQADSLRAQAESEKDPGVRAGLLARAQKAQAARDGAQRSFVSGGGCHPGVFYVRDSIYSDPAGPQYDYDLSRKGDEAPYGKSLVQLEYDWVRTMGNHVTQILLAN